MKHFPTMPLPHRRYWVSPSHGGPTDRPSTSNWPDSRITHSILTFPNWFARENGLPSANSSKTRNSPRNWSNEVSPSWSRPAFLSTIISSTTKKTTFWPACISGKTGRAESHSSTFRRESSLRPKATTITSINCWVTSSPKKFFSNAASEKYSKNISETDISPSSSKTGFSPKKRPPNGCCGISGRKT